MQCNELETGCNEYGEVFRRVLWLARGQRCIRASGAGVAGTNTLDFFVNNDGGPTGVRVEFFTAAAVPEPSSMTLLGLGALSLGGYVLRRRRQAVKG